MQDKTTILMRRMGVKTEKSGWFGRESHLVLDGQCGDSEVLCAVRKDGTNAHVVEIGERGRFADGQAPNSDELLFAVRCVSFYLNMTIPAGIDAENFHWAFKVGGELTVHKPEIFTLKFRGAVSNDEPLIVETFENWLGTIPATTLHDKVIVDVLGVVSLQDKDAEDRYVDMQYRMEQSKEVGEKVISSALAKAFSDFFGAEGAVSMSVTSFHAFSADREANLAADEAHDAEIRKNAAEIADLQHELELARLHNEKAKIEADTESLRAKSKLLLEKGEAVDKLMNMNFSAGNAPDLAKILDFAGKGDAVGRIMDFVNSSMRGDVRVTMELDPRTRAVGPRLFVMRQGGFYGLSIDIPRDGHLVLLDVCDDDKVVPVVPCSDAKSKSSFVQAGKRVFVGSRSSQWIEEPFEQYDGEGKDRFVAFVTKTPVLQAEESVQFGEALRPDMVSLIADRLAAMDPKDVCGGLLQVKIESK